MSIGLIIDTPLTLRHPVISEVLRLLQPRQRVTILTSLDSPYRRGSDQQMIEAVLSADLYQLKGHTVEALQLARLLEMRGARVVNSAQSGEICRDRLQMHNLLARNGLSGPRTWAWSSPEDLLREAAKASGESMLPFPAVIKSRYSARNDLITRVDRREDLAQLARDWPHEPLILQELLPSDGRDIKLWMIGSALFAARRRSPLWNPAEESDEILASEAIPSAWREIAHEVGHVFGLQLYGVDLLETERGAVVLDVNAFPGFRGVHDAAQVLVAFIEHLLCEPSSLLLRQPDQA